MATTSTYLVSGMTCGGCAGKVTDKVEAVDGVVDVDVDLATGGLTVTSNGVDDAAIHAAVRDAGYELGWPHRTHAKEGSRD